MDFYKKYFHSRLQKRAAKISNQIKKYLSNGDKVLDIGCGSGHIANFLLSEGFEVVPLDVKNLSFLQNIKPLTYNGHVLPFADNSFDAVLLIAVLHHTPDPERVLKEAKRVAKRVIVMEGIYENKIQKYIADFFDSLASWEFTGHPHSSKTDEGWKILFAKLGLNLSDVQYGKFSPIAKRVIYYLEK